MNELYRDYSGKNVQLIYVNANSTESPDQVEQTCQGEWADVQGLQGRRQCFGGSIWATVTPETFVFDQGGTLLYHGYIDDSTNVARVHVHGLRDALEAVIAGRPVPMKEARSFGCTIKRVGNRDEGSRATLVGFVDGGGSS